MYDLQLTLEQVEFRDTVRDFVTREIKPVVLHPSLLQDPQRAFADHLVEQAAQMGLRTLALSEAQGGVGADALTCCIVCEELAAGDAGIAATLVQTSLLGHLLFDRAMTTVQRERYLPDFLSKHRYHLALALADPEEQSAWRYHRPRRAPQAAVLAKVEGDEWVLEGIVPFVANAPLAELFVVPVRGADGGAGPVLIVPRNTAGMTLGAMSDEAEGRPAVPWFHGTAARLVLEKCRVPRSNALQDGAAQLFSYDGVHAECDMLQGAAIHVGIGRAAYEAALEYTKLRWQGGRHIVEHQAIGTMLAEMAIRIEAARNMVWKAAWAVDQPGIALDPLGQQLPWAHMAKIFVSEAMREVTEMAAECFGAMGVMLDMPLPKYVHEALMHVHSGRSNSVAKFRVAEAVAGFRTAPDA